MADLKTQQTPKEEAQVPLAVPPSASHSLELRVGVVKFCIRGDEAENDQEMIDLHFANELRL